MVQIDASHLAIVSAATPAESDVHRLARNYRRVSLSLAGILFAVYAVFMLLVAFGKPFLAEQIVPGLSVGIVCGAGIIVFACLIACIYVYWANRYHDVACDRLV